MSTVKGDDEDDDRFKTDDKESFTLREESAAFDVAGSSLDTTAANLNSIFFYSKEMINHFFILEWIPSSVSSSHAEFTSYEERASIRNEQYPCCWISMCNDIFFVVPDIVSTFY